MSTILKKLRLKFMGMTTGIVALLVVIIATGYCVSVYTAVTDEISATFNHSLDAVSRQISPPPHFLDQMNPPTQHDDGNFVDDQQNEEENPEQRIDLFRGNAALVYSVVINSDGLVLRNYSPAIELDDSVLSDAISAILGSGKLSFENDSDASGKLDDSNLLYHAKVQNGNIYLSLTDAEPFEQRVRDAVIGASTLSIIAVFLTVLVSFFLARLFMRPVEEAWIKQRRFVADASHELKTPLTVIMADTEILRSDPQKTIGDQSKWLDGISDESERMNALIADLLLLARIDDENASTSNPQTTTVDFSEILESALLSFDAVAFEKNISIDGSIEPDIAINGVASRLSRLPDILVDNACKYTASGGLVKITLAQQGHDAVLHVFNTGNPIPSEDIERLFDRFYRADESRSNDIPGYGLGLSIAQNIVEEIGGSIKVENSGIDENEFGLSGVMFTVALPRSS